MDGVSVTMVDAATATAESGVALAEVASDAYPHSCVMAAFAHLGDLGLQWFDSFIGSHVKVLERFPSTQVTCVSVGGLEGIGDAGHKLILTSSIEKAKEFLEADEGRGEILEVTFSGGAASLVKHESGESLVRLPREGVLKTIAGFEEEVRKAIDLLFVTHPLLQHCSVFVVSSYYVCHGAYKGAKWGQYSASWLVWLLVKSSRKTSKEQFEELYHQSQRLGTISGISAGFLVSSTLAVPAVAASGKAGALMTWGSSVAAEAQSGLALCTALTASVPVATAVGGVVAFGATLIGSYYLWHEKGDGEEKDTMVMIQQTEDEDWVILSIAPGSSPSKEDQLPKM
mmetsp:Transcript_54502/g.116439  ORF Transcript_54502/g.116439 Transcript_54502/m.116439 type:complete len:342 (+) Transcript_54502:161-1186(+)